MNARTLGRLFLCVLFVLPLPWAIHNQPVSALILFVAVLGLLLRREKAA